MSYRWKLTVLTVCALGAALFLLLPLLMSQRSQLRSKIREAERDYQKHGGEWPVQRLADWAAERSLYCELGELALDDSESLILRERAVQVLGAIGDERAVSCLWTIIARTEGRADRRSMPTRDEPIIMGHAILQLREARGPVELGRLLEIARAENEWLGCRREALRVIQARGTATEVPELIRLYQAVGTETLRPQIARVVEELASTDFGDYHEDKQAFCRRFEAWAAARGCVSHPTATTTRSAD